MFGKPSKLLAAPQMRHRHDNCFPVPPKRLDQEFAIAMASENHNTLLTGYLWQKFIKHFCRPSPPFGHPKIL